MAGKQSSQQPKEIQTQNTSRLIVDPISVDSSKKWARKTLAENTRTQISCERKVELFDKEKKKALHQLQNSKSYYNELLKQTQDRQVAILKKREQEKILIQAQTRYNNAPVLETKRFCGACARRPKSAKAGFQVNVDGLIKLSSATNSHSLTFNAYEHLAQPPKPFIRRALSASAVPLSKSANHDEVLLLDFSGEEVSKHPPSPAVTPPTSRPISPMRSFDLSSIPNFSRTKRRVSRSGYLS